MAVFASPAVNEMISATIACSLLVQLDTDSIPVDVPISLTALRALRLPDVFRRLLAQGLPGATLDAFDPGETAALVSHGSLFRPTINTPLGDHHVTNDCALGLLAFDPLDAAFFPAL